MGTKRCFASCREAKRTMGPSAPPIIETAAASAAVRPNIRAMGKVNIVPSSAGIASNKLILGFAIKKSNSVIEPMPIKTIQAIKPFEKVSAYMG